MNTNIDDGVFKADTYYSSDSLDAIFLESLNPKSNSIVSVVLKKDLMDEPVVEEIEKVLREKRDTPCCVLFVASEVHYAPIGALQNVATMIATLEKEGTEFIKTGIIVKGIRKQLLDVIFRIKKPIKPTKSFGDIRDAYYYLLGDEN